MEALLGGWYTALSLSGAARASIAVIGDSITDGYLATNFDTQSWVSVLRSLLQDEHGDGGEGFVSCLHTNPVAAGENPIRWSFSGAEWTKDYSAARTGKGAIAGAKSTSGTSEMSVTATATTLQILTSTNHVGGADLGIYVDTVLEGTQDCLGDGSGNLDYTNVLTISGLTDASHTIMFRRDSVGLVSAQGVRALRGTTGVVVDRYGKGWMRAEWLGDVNDGTPGAEFFQALHFIETIGADLFIVALGINDYLNQVALATYESRLTTIVQRCKLAGDVAILVYPQPNSALAIPYSDYVSRMQTVAVAEGCAFWNIRSLWGSVFQSIWMGDANHPNSDGHRQIGEYIFSRIRII